MKDNWFVCLKWGNKYSAEYVNTLHSMFKRNHSKEIRFACYTENRQGLNKEIEVFNLPGNNPELRGWWYKPCFFDPKLPTQGTILFCDLDVVIFRSIDKFFDIDPGKFCIIRDFNRHLRQNWNRMNSSMFRLDVGDHSYVYKDFVKDYKTITRRYQGDQDYLYAAITDNFSFFPDRWAESYKWEMRGKPEMRKINGVRNFVQKGNPRVHPECSVAVFHGEPNPPQCEDQWVIDNYR